MTTSDQGQGRPHIAFVFRADRVGGTERRAAEVATHLATQSILAVALNISQDSKSQANRLFNAAFAGTHVEKNSIRAMIHLIRCQPQFVIAHGMKVSLACRALKAVGLLRSAQFAARNGLDMGWPPIWHRIDSVTQGYTSYLANSMAVQSHLVASGISMKRIYVVPPALPETWFVQSANKTNQPPVVAMVGNHRPEKNQLQGMQAFLSLNTDATLVLYTDEAGWVFDELKNWPKQRRNSVQVVTGHVMTPHDYDAIHILLHPSLSESVPRAVLEAKARGCLIAATDVGSTREVISDNEDEILLSAVPTDLEICTALRSLLLRVGSPKTIQLELSVRGVKDYVHDLLAALESGAKRNRRD